MEHSETLNESEQRKHSGLKYFINSYVVKNYIGKPEKSKPPRFDINLWNVHEATLKGKYFICFLNLHFYKILYPGLPRTNNAAEGWNSAFKAMNGVTRPTIYRFIDNLKKDQALARAKIFNCLACKPSETPQKIYDDRDASLKTAVERYNHDIEQARKAAEAHADSDSDSDDENNAQGNEGSTVDVDPKQLWLQSPAKKLLSTVAHNIRL